MDSTIVSTLGPVPFTVGARRGRSVASRMVKVGAIVGQLVRRQQRRGDRAFGCFGKSAHAVRGRKQDSLHAIENQTSRTAYVR
jgi:hypothetical protein